MSVRLGDKPLIEAVAELDTQALVQKFEDLSERFQTFQLWRLERGRVEDLVADVLLDFLEGPVNE